MFKNTYLWLTCAADIIDVVGDSEQMGTSSLWETVPALFGPVVTHGHLAEIAITWDVTD